MPVKTKRLDTKGVALVMAQGRAYQSGSFLLKVLFTKLEYGLDKGLFVSFIAPKKVFETAIKRNLVKRRLRAAFQKVLKENQIDSPTQAVLLALVARQVVISIDFDQLVQEIKRILEKSGIL